MLSPAKRILKKTAAPTNISGLTATPLTKNGADGSDASRAPEKNPGGKIKTHGAALKRHAPPPALPIQSVKRKMRREKTKPIENLPTHSAA